MPGENIGQRLGIAAAGIVGIVVLVSLFYTGSSEPPKAIVAPSAPVNPVSAAAHGGASPPIDLQCLASHIQNAPAPFHLSFKKTTKAMSGDWEADITQNSIDGASVNDSGTQRIHGVRSNAPSWNAAVAAVTGPISGTANTIALVRNSPALTRAASENVNGEDTIKYTIDTGNDPAEDASLIKNIMGDGGFIKGTAWVTKQGCPVKLVLDTEMHLQGGGVETEHYESNVTEK